MTSKDLENEQSTAGVTIGLLIIPAIASFFGAIMPEWSWGYAVGFAVILLLLLLYSLIITLTKWYKTYLGVFCT
ncbi:hypothetical protein JCM19037_4675 [Geomicrobium sp. JCM 19037]|uniref:hypothetical protein n=1 Tax=Geomicrobium sp. JCM 19037 TaxID=1460634 RepID=UPI00045F4D8A|nr:hypothetical protein [Geomicrobium sp. JCM 19037]GAK06107.1 hypothetical protein JCM19037_4675 [Geomicrobium sp. JCM 19037]